MTDKIKSIITPTRAGKALNTLALVSPKRAGSNALKLFCTPQSGQTFTAKEQKFVDTASAQKVQYGDHHIQTYHWENDGPLILLAHGWDSNAARWRALVSGLKHAGFSVVALDAPAHGKSFGKQTNGREYAACLNEVIEFYKPRFAIGHSFGGMSLAFYLAEYNDALLSKTVLMATPSYLSSVIHQYYEVLGLSNRTRALMSDAFRDQFEFDIDYFTAGEFISKVSTPGLIMHDKNDEVIKVNEAMHIHENWKNSELYLTEGLGHTLQSGNVFKKIIQYLQQ